MSEIKEPLAQEEQPLAQKEEQPLAQEEEKEQPLAQEEEQPLAQEEEQPLYKKLSIDTNNEDIQLQIPKIIYICHKNINCLSMTHNKWKTLNPTYEIFLFDDSLCEHFLLNEYSELHYNIFKFIPDGPIKSDFWRLCILYKYGGIYVDSDIHPLIPLDNYLIPTSDFVTCITQTNKSFNPHFIAVKKKEHILQLCINEYIEMYNSKRHLYEYWSWSVINVFNKYLNKLRDPRLSTIVFGNKKFQFFIEKTNSHLRSPNLHDYYCIFNKVRLFNSRYINYHPYDHEFKDGICISYNSDNSVYNMFDINNTLTHLNSRKIQTTLLHKRSIRRSINGNMSRNIDRSINVNMSKSGRSKSGNSRNMSKSGNSRNMSKSGNSRNMSKSSRNMSKSGRNIRQNFSIFL